MGSRVKECIVCGGKDFDDYHGVLIKCAKCSLIVAREIPTKKEVDDLYKKEYFFGKEYFDYEADRPALERNFRVRINSMQHMLGKEKNIVEIGCAYGYFMNLIKNNARSIIGFDVTHDGVSFARNRLGLDAHTEDFMQYPFKDASIDSVFMWDVAEHLAYPDDYFKKIAKILKKGGKVAITTGNVEALVPKLRKGNWRMIHPPTHVYYFSPQTLGALLEKHGFKVESVRHRSVSRNVGSVFNQLISNNKASSKNSVMLKVAHSAAKKLGAEKLNIPINMFDIMEVVATKTS